MKPERITSRKSGLPGHLRPLLWDTTPARLDLERDAWFLMGRVLEFGTMRDVRWLQSVYGDERIHEFFRVAADPELSPRTITLWRLYFRAEKERWRSPPAFRRSSSSSWVD